MALWRGRVAVPWITRMGAILGHLLVARAPPGHLTWPFLARFPHGAHTVPPPVTTGLSRIRNRVRNAGWSPRRDSNPRPLPYQGSALPTELRGPGDPPILPGRRVQKAAWERLGHGGATP